MGAKPNEFPEMMVFLSIFSPAYATMHQNSIISQAHISGLNLIVCVQHCLILKWNQLTCELVMLGIILKCY